MYSSPSDSTPSSLLMCLRTQENSDTIVEAKRHDGAVSFTAPVLEGAGGGAFRAPNKRGAGGGAGGIAGETKEAIRAPGKGAGGEPAWTEEACRAPGRGTGGAAGGGASGTGKAFRAPTMRGAGQGKSGAGEAFTAPSKGVREKATGAGEDFSIACALSSFSTSVYAFPSESQCIGRDTLAWNLVAEDKKNRDGAQSLSSLISTSRSSGRASIAEFAISPLRQRISSEKSRTRAGVTSLLSNGRM